MQNASHGFAADVQYLNMIARFVANLSGISFKNDLTSDNWIRCFRALHYDLLLKSMNDYAKQATKNF